MFIYLCIEKIEEDNDEASPLARADRDRTGYTEIWKKKNKLAPSHILKSVSNLILNKNNNNKKKCILIIFR